jgi:hypothetical protein
MVQIMIKTGENIISQLSEIQKLSEASTHPDDSSITIAASALLKEQQWLEQDLPIPQQTPYPTQVVSSGRLSKVNS